MYRDHFGRMLFVDEDLDGPGFWTVQYRDDNGQRQTWVSASFPLGIIGDNFDSVQTELVIIAGEYGWERIGL